MHKVKKRTRRAVLWYQSSPQASSLSKLLSLTRSPPFSSLPGFPGSAYTLSCLLLTQLSKISHEQYSVGKLLLGSQTH